MSLRAEILRAVCQQQDGDPDDADHLEKIHGWQADALLPLLTREVARENEACAKIAGDQGCTKVACGESGHGYHACPQSIAAVIRARREAPAPMTTDGRRGGKS